MVELNDVAAVLMGCMNDIQVFRHIHGIDMVVMMLVRDRYMPVPGSVMVMPLRQVNMGGRPLQCQKCQNQQDGK